MPRRITVIAVALAALTLQGCAVAIGTVAGTAIGVTGKAVGGAAKVGGKVVVATGKAIIPGESKKDRERREYEEWKRSR